MRFAIRMLAADLVRLVHYALLPVVVSGPFLPRKYVPYYLIFVWLIFLDWNDFDGMCILTRIEHWLRTGIWASKSPIEGGPEFFRPILLRLGFRLDRYEADRLNNFVFLMFWGITFIKYVWITGK
jgi:hypothetical protein